MGIDKRIAEIGSYFKAYNIESGVVYAMVVFPEKWTIPESIDELNVKTAHEKDNQPGVYFFSTIDEGPEKVFDAIDYVIELNKSIEEKTGLLIQKANELKEIFSTTPIEKLRNLYFAFYDNEPKQSKTRKKSARQKTVKEKKEVVQKEEAPLENNENMESQILTYLNNSK